MVDIAAVPHRFENAVREPKNEDILDRLLAQIMVDAIDLVLRQDLLDLAVERSRGIEIVSERFLENDAPPLAAGLVGQSRGAQLPHHLAKKVGRGREVVKV